MATAKRINGISVVIPTCDRPDTAIATIRSCLAQQSEQLQIIVSDNASQTRVIADYCAAADDQRIRYVRTGKRLGMAQHWEFALGHVQTKYVIYIGDDDALLPGAIQKIQNILDTYKVDAVRWLPSYYQWPGHIDTRQSNQLRVVINQLSGKPQYPAAQVLNEVLQFKRPNVFLPCIYHGCVSTAAIDRARSGGIFFNSHIPDYYSEMALSPVINNVYFQSNALTVAGSSKHSNGSAFINKKHDKNNQLENFMNESSASSLDREIFSVSSNAMVLADSYYRAREHISELKRFKISEAALCESAAAELAKRAPDQMPQLANALNALEKRYEFKMAIPPSDILNRSTIAEPVLAGFEHASTVVLDARNFRIQTVWGAAKLTALSLKMQKVGVLKLLRIFNHIMNRLQASSINTRRFHD